MRHTVIGLFNTYTQADGARNMLVQTGFASSDIVLQANPETPAEAAAVESPGVIANIERFLSSLFATSGPTAPEAERYTEAVRRGAVLVCVNATSEAHAELARNSLTKLGAIEVSERSPEWDTRIDEPQARREQSIVDELGIDTPAAMPTAAQAPLDPLRADEVERQRARMDALHGVPPVDEPSPSSDAIAAASVPGAGAVLRPAVDAQRAPLSGEYRDYAPPTSAKSVPLPPDSPSTAALASGAVAGSGAVLRPDMQEPAYTAQPIPDEFLEYEEDFRTHYDEEYAHEGLRYDEYVPAYHYGATMAREIRYQDRPWEEVEDEARTDWERGKPVDSWERFKAAVRHGWDRVTGHHHI